MNYIPCCPYIYHQVGESGKWGYDLVAWQKASIFTGVAYQSGVTACFSQGSQRRLSVGVKVLSQDIQASQRNRCLASCRNLSGKRAHEITTTHAPVAGLFRPAGKHNSPCNSHLKYPPRGFQGRPPPVARTGNSHSHSPVVFPTSSTPAPVPASKVPCFLPTSLQVLPNPPQGSWYPQALSRIVPKRCHTARAASWLEVVCC